MASGRWIAAGLALAWTILAGASPARADDHDTVIAVMPVFSQLVAWRLPPGFRRANEESHAGHYLFEAVREGDTLDDWSQLVTLTGAAGLADHPEVTPELFANRIASNYQQTCPDSYYGVELDAPAIDGYDTYAAVAGCGNVPGSHTAHGETALIVVIKGAHDLYSLQWAERDPAQPEPPRIDAEQWSSRMAQLLPIRVCDRVPGEQAPYPSCTAHITLGQQPSAEPAPAKRSATHVDSDAIEAGWDAAGFTLTLQHYLSTLAATCDPIPEVKAAGGKGLLEAWQDRGRNGVFLDVSRMYQTALVTAVQKSTGKQAADRLLAGQMDLVRRMGDDEAKKLLAGTTADTAQTCRRAAADVAAGEYDITRKVAYYATLDRMAHDLGADDGTEGRSP